MALRLKHADKSTIISRKKNERVTFKKDLRNLSPLKTRALPSTLIPQAGGGGWVWITREEKAERETIL